MIISIHQLSSLKKCSQLSICLLTGPVGATIEVGLDLRIQRIQGVQLASTSTSGDYISLYTRNLRMSFFSQQHIHVQLVSTQPTASFVLQMVFLSPNHRAEPTGKSSSLEKKVGVSGCVKVEKSWKFFGSEVKETSTVTHSPR